MKASHCVELLFVSQPIDARIAVVFLHGVDTNVEHGWSQPGAHKSFVTRLSEELPAAAVGTFTYPCTLRHFVEDGLSIEQLARGVAASFRDHLLEAYRTIVVVGHCLGGSIAVTALRMLSEQQPLWSPAWANLVMFLIDVPFTTSDQGPSEWLGGLMEVLRYPRELLEANAEFWKERELRMPIEAYALISDGPSWITPLRPDAWLPDDNIRRLPLSHLEIARPAGNGPFPTCDYIVERLVKLEPPP